MCVFCEIVKGEIPAYKVYEDELCVAFLDLSQANVGHVLVVTKEHFENILDVSEEALCAVMKAVKKITIALNKLLKCRNFNILNNCGIMAGQSVKHFHVHIIPRIKNDEIQMHFPKHHFKDNELEALKEAIVSSIGD